MTVFACLPENSPCSFDFPTDGRLRLIEEFPDRKKAEEWVNQGCPGVFLPPDGRRWMAGWNRVPATPKWCWLTERAADALEWEEQQKKFAWLRHNIRLLEYPPELDRWPDWALGQEAILPWPGHDALAEAYTLRSLTVTSQPMMGLPASAGGES